MNFDKERYLADYVMPRKSATKLADDDLVERYALTLPAGDAEIAAQIRAVRSFWNVQRPGTRPGKVSQLCLTDDERLRKQHGDSMLTAKWWAQREAKGREASKERVEGMAGMLRSAYGQLGIVTPTVVEQFAAKLGLNPAQGGQAAQQAGLTVVEGVELPQASPIPPTTMRSLSEALVASGARSVPHLVHPDSGPFRLLKRFVSLKDQNLRLDAVAVREQITAANRRGTSAEDTARRTALNILNSAANDGVDLAGLALFHLVSIAAELGALGPGPVLAELRGYGLDDKEAAVVALLVVTQKLGGPVGIERVQSLLAEGRLHEADQAAEQLPAGMDRKPEAQKLVRRARERLNSLLVQAESARQTEDEARALMLVREASAISRDDAAALLGSIPLPPPIGLRLVADGDTVRAVWQPGPGHEDGTIYLLARSAQRPPISPADGRELDRTTRGEFADPHVPVAQRLYYSVFALLPGRPHSRPASASIALLPPISDLKAEVGPESVTLLWSAHPSAERVEVFRTEPNHQPVPIRSSGNMCSLNGLQEGKPLHFEVFAVYRGSDARELRSEVAQINATPRSQARPVSRLRARPVDVAGSMRVRISWPAADNSDVRIVRSSSPGPWAPGQSVAPEDINRLGVAVTGTRTVARGEVTLESELPPGVHHLVALSSGGSGTVTGASAVVGVTDPVTNVRATVFSDHAVLAWDWPTTAQLAEVSWEADGDADVLTVGRAQYGSSGVRLPLGRAVTTVEVRALIHVDGMRFAAPPAAVQVAGITQSVIRYEVKAAGLRAIGRSRRIILRSHEACENLRVQVVISPGPVMPLSVEKGVCVLDTQLNLLPGGSQSHEFSVPRSISRPFWIRAFLTGGSGRLIDPPITQLKEG